MKSWEPSIESEQMCPNGGRGSASASAGTVVTVRHCRSCRRGEFITCANGQIPGIRYDGGYADYMIAPFEALASVPDELGAEEAAPLLCAGITTYNALRNSGARAGDVVAVLGIGGLGHLGVQFAAKMGCRTVAIARGADKEPLARKLGAHHYLDSVAQDVAGELNKLGGARVILSTVTSSKAISAAVGGLDVNGRLMVIGAAPDAIEVSPLVLIGGASIDSGMAVRNIERFRGDDGLQRSSRHPTDD
jgi:D-arabinose 1-dehydrogenase-like Zn-dependent alcohol dehydrogenase